MELELSSDGLMFAFGQVGVRTLDDAYKIVNQAAGLAGMEAEFELPRSEYRIIPERYGVTYQPAAIFPWRLRELP